MSYILDALRKAEAERERGHVPSIHAQPTFAGLPPGSAPVKSRLAMIMIAVGVLLALAIALLTYVLLGRSATNGVAVAAASAPLTVTPAAPLVVASVPAAPAVALVTPTQAVPTTAPTTPPTTTPSQTAPPPRKPRPAATAASPAAPTPTPQTTQSAATPAPATSAAKFDGRIYVMEELPDDIRRQLPALMVGGSMFSPTPASRLVIVNGQVLHEGEHLTPDLVVQQIRLKSAVLSFKGYRYVLNY